jgi:hypothetical protein
MTVRRRLLKLLGVAVGIPLIAVSTRSFANEQCEQLEVLAQQDASVQLTLAQKQMKRQMVMWYSKNCHERRSADAN